MKIEFRKSLIALAILSSSGPGISMPSLAQSAGTAAASGQRSDMQAVSADMRASQLIGKQVKSAQGAHLGTLDDVIVNVDNERVHYAVLSFGGLLGLGDKLIALPASMFGTGADRDQLILHVSKEQLRKAPGFGRERRPNFSQDTYRSEVDRFFFKEEITRHTPSGARLIGATDLIGKKINDRAAHNAGRIADLVVNFGSGRAYAVMEVDKAWSPDSKLLPLPFSALMFPSRPDRNVALNVDRAVIETARGFEKNKWPDLNSASAQKEITDHLLSFQVRSKESPAATQTGRDAASGSSQ